jgi:hypothetical protein
MRKRDENRFLDLSNSLYLKNKKDFRNSSQVFVLCHNSRRKRGQNAIWNTSSHTGRGTSSFINGETFTYPIPFQNQFFILPFSATE